MHRPVVHRRVYADELVAHNGAILVGGELLADGVGAATVTIRDGLNTDAGAVFTFTAATSSYDRQNFPNPIPMRSGLYVDLGSNVSHFILYFILPGAEDI